MISLRACVELPEFGSSSTDFGTELIVRGPRPNIEPEKFAVPLIFKLG